MGWVDLMGQPNLNRSEVYDLVQEAKQQNKGRKQHVREKLTERYPDLATATVTRNGHVYNVLDYLELDLDSYGD